MNMSLSDLASATFAVGLIIPVAITSMEFNNRPTWYRATSFLALTLVLLGYASSLFLSLHFEDHRAYLVAFCASTFGACWLIVASIMNLHRILLHLQALEETAVSLRIFRMSSKGVLGTLVLVQAAAIGSYLIGSIHLAHVHSEKPIQGLADVLARVECEERSASSMLAGHVLETTLLLSFSIVLLALGRYIPSAKVMHFDQPTIGYSSLALKKLVRSAYYSNIATVVSVMVRTMYHLVEFFMAEPEGLEVAATSTLGFYLDLLPVFCACWAVLRQSSSLNTADDLAETWQSGWPGNEKQASLC